MSKELLEQVSKDKLLEMLLAERTEKDQLKAIVDEVTSKGKKASEGQLDDLQGVVANVMTDQVLYKEALVSFDANGEEVVGEQRYVATPALLGVVVKFLKDNSIITDVNTNENTKSLQDAMARKTKRSDRLPTGSNIKELLAQG